MKDKKIFIRRDSGAESTWLKGLNATIDAGNSLIELFNSGQNFKQIETLNEFIELLSDPLQYYDNVLMENISHDSRLQVNMSVLSLLYNIPRVEYLTGLGMTPEQVSQCGTCGGDQVLSEGKVLSFSRYTDYALFLSWEAGQLFRNEIAIKNISDTWNVYASSPEQIEIVNFWNLLRDVLNSYHDKYLISPDDKRLIAKSLKLSLSEGYEGVFCIHDINLSLEIQKTK